jgi:hypothetical protein
LSALPVADEDRESGDLRSSYGGFSFAWVDIEGRHFLLSQLRISNYWAQHKLLAPEPEAPRPRACAPQEAGAYLEKVCWRVFDTALQQVL